MAIMRFNALQPPFDKPMMRRAMLGAVNQDDYLVSVPGGESGDYRVCHPLFPCGTPYGSPASPDPMSETTDLDKARAMVREAGYAGERVVILSPTDFPSIAPFGQITYDLMRKLGPNAELVETDWGSLLTRRNNRSPAALGGWSVFHTWNSGGSVFDPVRNGTIRGLGEKGTAGWYRSDRMEAHVQEWLASSAPEERAKIAAEMEDLAAKDVPTGPIGQFHLKTACRKSIVGIVPSPTPVPWGVRKV